MKKLQAVKADPLRPWTGYAQVKNGRVIVVTNMLIINLPAEDVFGTEVIKPEDHFYIDRAMWGTLKFPSAKWIIRVEDTLTFRNSHGLEMKMLSAAEFTGKIGKYPDWEAVVHQSDRNFEAVERIGLNPELLSQIHSVWGVNSEKYRFNFYSPERGIIIDHHESGGWAMLMSIFIKNDSFESGFYKQPEAEKEPSTDEMFAID